MPRILPLVALATLVALPTTAQSVITGPALCSNGTALLGGTSYACGGVDVMSLVPTGVDGPMRTGAMNDIWGWTDPDTGREYALGGTRSGTVFVDVTDPANPLVLGKLLTETGNSSWRDIKVYQNHAFVVSEAENHGMQVFDLTRLRGLSPDDQRDFAPDAVYIRIGSAHNLVINESTGFAYAVGYRNRGSGLPASCNAPGFHAINIQSPLAPTFAGCFNDAPLETGPRTPGYTHDAQCVTYSGPDPDYQGRELCFAANEDVLRVFDATDKGNVATISQGAYPGFAYTHQGWLTEDQRYFLLNDELDESNGTTPSQRTMVFDLLDVDDPEFVFAYQSGLNTIDHNLYTRGRYAFESNYQSGLRIVDTANIGSGSLSEVAFFDTYPQGTSAEFNGNWSNYPYFASGTVVASDIDNGLFVLRPTNLIVSEAPTPAPGAFDLSAPTPNPTAGASTLNLRVAAPEAVRAVVLDATGREVAVVFDGTVTDAATLRVETAGLAAGVYVVRVVGATFSATRRLSVTR
jgi:choice-of-anchor B domain-containing protein